MNFQNDAGDSPFHIACRMLQENTVTLFLRYNADPNATNRKFETPISLAVDSNDQDIIDILRPDTRNLVREKLRRIRLSMLEESISHELLDVVARFTPPVSSGDDEEEGDGVDSKSDSDHEAMESTVDNILGRYDDAESGSGTRKNGNGALQGDSE